MNKEKPKKKKKKKRSLEWFSLELREGFLDHGFILSSPSFHVHHVSKRHTPTHPVFGSCAEVGDGRNDTRYLAFTVTKEDTRVETESIAIGLR